MFWVKIKSLFDFQVLQEEHIKIYIKKNFNLQNFDLVIETQYEKILDNNYEAIIGNIRSNRLFVIVTIDDIPQHLKEYFILVEYQPKEQFNIYKNLQDKLKYSDIEYLETRKKFKDFIGREKLKDKFNTLSKGVIFFLGLSRVGKSYFVECFAGEKNLPIIDLNLQLISEKESPITYLHYMFQTISKHNIKAVIRIDEIEKALSDDRFISQLLIILNDLNTDIGYKFDGYIFATSNNISDILDTKPEMLGEGRFDEKILMTYPTWDDYQKMIESQNLNVDINAMLHHINDYFKENRALKNKFIYSPAELNKIIQLIKQTGSNEITTEIMEQACDKVVPMQIFAQDGFTKTLAHAERTKFTKVD